MHDEQGRQQVILKAGMIGKKMASIDEAPFDFWKLIVSHNYYNCGILNAILGANLVGIEEDKK